MEKKKHYPKRHRYTQEQVYFLLENYSKLTLKELTTTFNIHFKIELSYTQIKYKLRYMKISKRNVQKNYGKYTPEMVDWLVENRGKIKLEEMTKKFNQHFGATFTKSALWHKSYRLKHGNDKRSGTYLPRLNWTKAHVKFLKENYEKYPYWKLAKIMSEEFNARITASSIEHKLGRLGLKKSPEAIKLSQNEKIRSQFYFKKGRISDNRKPVGTEVESRGYIWVKVKNPDKWQQKHRYIWEQHHGKIPDGHAVIFLDSNKENFDIENLALITKGENGLMNTAGLRFGNAEHTKVGIQIARLKIKTYTKLKERKKRHVHTKQT